MARQPQKILFALPERDLAHILEQARTDLESLRGKKIFITGGTGFFGKWLLAGLIFANDELNLRLKLCVFSRAPETFIRKHPEVASISALSFIAGHLDATDFSIPYAQFDYIVHAGTDTTAFVAHEEEQRRSLAILSGTTRMIELLRRSKARRILNLSSGAVYGGASSKVGGAVEEDATTNSGEPLIPYGKAKLAAERLCAGASIDFVTARAFTFLGPYLPLDAHFAAGNFLRDAIRGGPILVRGDGTALRSYLHPADLIVWLLRILVQGRAGRAYNVGSDEAVTTAQLANLISCCVDPTPEVVIQSLEPHGAQNIYLPNIQRARAELNLKVTISLREAIARTIDFLPHILR